MSSGHVLRSVHEKVLKNRANPPLFGTFWRGFYAIPQWPQTQNPKKAKYDGGIILLLFFFHLHTAIHTLMA